ncbi:MAG: hypothetical protein KAJ42_00105, partial [Gemmatimonadetes bacterium]|nr:hypothetical protein [Gemmatimonadota bacterium]
YYSESFTRSWSGTATIVKSLTDHWSAGFKSSGSYSTYSNLDLALHGGPVLEYDVFPYSESTRRMLTFQYAIEGHHYDYMEPTIHGKLKERRVSESLAASLTLTQPWGSGMVFLEGEHLLDDIDQHHVTLGAYLSFRLFKGLRFNVSGSYSRVKDLLSPVGGNLTEEELLLRLRQLQTDYRYSTRMGFSYTFGSIYNNIVNPRLESGFGGIMIMY